MNNIEILLTNRWILKRNNRELYYSIKDNAKDLRKYFLDAFGYSLIVHSEYIKLDKVAGKAEPWMGISEFKSKEEYMYLCFILMFLEEKDGEEQFVLSNLCEYLQIQLNVSEDFWNVFTNRKKLVNVLRFCIKEFLIIQNDGDTDSFAQMENAEVLFENTGLSRYFMRSFTSNIFEKTYPEQFMHEEWERQEDRGDARKHRVYRRLLLSIGIYQESKELDDFDYIRKFRKNIQRDFLKIAPYDLQVQKSSAYLVLNEENKFAKSFPGNNAMDELIILLFTYLRKRIKNSDIKRDKDEFIYLDESYVHKMIQNIIKKEEAYLPSTYRKKKEGVLAKEILEEAISLGFAWRKDGQLVFAPSIGKWTGFFVEDNHGTK